MPHRIAQEIIRNGVSLRTRLTAWVVGLFVVIQSITTGVIFLYQRSAIEAGADRQLRARAVSLRRGAEEGGGVRTAGRLQQMADAEARAGGYPALRSDLLDAGGVSVVSSGLEWPASVVASSAHDGASRVLRAAWFGGEEGPVRVVVLPAGGGAAGRVYVLAAPDRQAADQVLLMVRMLLIAGAVGLAASAVAGWYIAGIAVAPLHRLKDIAEQLRPESIGRQFPVGDRSLEVAQLTAALDEARQRIGEAFAAQERFLSNVSHEIKTPIATLLLEAQTIDRASLGREGDSFVRTTEEEMRKLGRLLESFLTLTRVRDGKGPAKLSRIQVNDIILDSTAHCAGMAKLHAVAVRPGLLDEEGVLDAAITGDPELIRTMVDNLVRNAIRFSPREGSVRLTARVEAARVWISVEDEGPGVPPELIDHIFDRFVQSPEELRRGRGHGLGLAIAQGVAELHGGSIRVQNTDPHGARFTVDLPLAGADPSAGEPAPSAAAPASGV